MRVFFAFAIILFALLSISGPSGPETVSIGATDVQAALDAQPDPGQLVAEKIGKRAGCLRNASPISPSSCSGAFALSVTAPVSPADKGRPPAVLSSADTPRPYHPGGSLDPPRFG